MRRLALAALLVLATSATGDDVVYLKGGRRLVGRVETRGDTVRIVMRDGTIEMTLPRDQIERIESQLSPSEELAGRRSALATGDVAAAVALADFAGDRDLAAERGELLELASGWAPDDARIRADLARWRAFERPFPVNQKAEAALLASVGKEARLYRTAHWRIAYDTDIGVARRRGEMLEAAWRKFQGLVERAGLSAHPLEDRLECVVFRDYAEWLEAVAMPEELVGRMVGIYIWDTRRVLLYDTRTSPGAKEVERQIADEILALADARDALEKQNGEIRRIEEALADGTAAKRLPDDRLTELRDWLDRTRKAVVSDRDTVTERESDLQRYRDELARHFADENVSSTTHEACHQLAFAFGVSRPGQPKWLIEGLATLFEAQSRASFVLEAPNEPRLKDVRAAWDRKENGNLVCVLTDAVFAVRGREPVAYAESWSLTYFLANRRPREFARFLAEGASLPLEGSADARLSDFRRFFGDDLDAIEHDWRAYVGRL